MKSSEKKYLDLFFCQLHVHIGHSQQKHTEENGSTCIDEERKSMYFAMHNLQESQNSVIHINFIKPLYNIHGVRGSRGGGSDGGGGPKK